MTLLAAPSLARTAVTAGLALGALVGTAGTAAAAADVTAPVLKAQRLSAAAVDTAAAARTVAVDVRVGDDASGIADVVVTLVSPSGRTTTSGSAGEPTGGVQDATYVVQVPVPRHSETGSWQVQVVLRDHSGNLRFLSAAELAATGPSTVLVTATRDAQAPVLVAGTLTPAWVDTARAARTVQAAVDLRDDLSGLADAHATFASGGSTVTGYARTDAVDLRQGRLVLPVVFPAGSAPGAWTLTSLVLRDRAGNVRTLSTADLQAAGAATVVRVARPAPAAPTAVAATAGVRAATVTWTAPAGSPATSWVVTTWRDGAAVRTATVAGTARRAVVPGLAAGAAYRFSVHAVAPAGAGAESVRTAAVRPTAG